MKRWVFSLGAFYVGALLVLLFTGRESALIISAVTLFLASLLIAPLHVLAERMRRRRMRRRTDRLLWELQKSIEEQELRERKRLLR